MSTPAGWYPNPDGGDQERYRNGQEWASETRSRPVPQIMNADQRKHQLAQVVAQQVAAGARVENQTDYQVVLVAGKNVNHLLHFLIGVLSCGLWWIVWIVLALSGGEKRYVIAVDEYGYIQRR
jgi:hypothetical protein